jgi:lipoyl(octanoyl) transferase
MSSSIQSSQSVSSQEVELIDLGVKDFKSTWDFQDALFQQIIRTKIENRERPEDQQVLTKHHLIFVEHPA